MPIATLSDYKTRLNSFNREIIPFNFNTTSLGLFMQGNILSVPAYTAPAAAPGAAPTNSTNGFLQFNNPTSKTLLLIGAELNSASPASLTLIDVLSHLAGLSGTITGVQGTSSAALTRYTDGIGVKLALSIHAQIGTTATTFTLSYTNSSDVAGRQSPLVAIGGTTLRDIGRFIPIPYFGDDIGVKSVQSTTLTATTGTAGSFGFTFYKPLAGLVIKGTQNETQYCNLINGGLSNTAVIPPNSALTFIIRTASIASGNLSGHLILTEVD
jgi:hypothetical protein